MEEKKPDIIVVGADPEGSILSGDSPRSYKVEGIGEDFIPVTFNRQIVDEMVRVSDKESFNTARRLAREEGLLVGGSSGTALAAALKYAQRLERPRWIVALLPDTGRNYLTKVFSDSWMQENGFWEEKEIRRTKVQEILARKRDLPAMISVSPRDLLSKAVELLHKYDISQLPVIDNGKVVGSLHESSLMKLLHGEIDFAAQQIGPVMGKPLPTLDEGIDAAEAYRVLLSGTTGIVVTRKDVPIGIITRVDLINHWMAERDDRR